MAGKGFTQYCFGPYNLVYVDQVFDDGFFSAYAENVYADVGHVGTSEHDCTRFVRERMNSLSITVFGEGYENASIDRVVLNDQVDVRNVSTSRVQLALYEQFVQEDVGDNADVVVRSGLDNLVTQLSRGHEGDLYLYDGENVNMYERKEALL